MIVVCGEALMDVVRNTDGTERVTPGGGPFNTARALGRLGVPVAFLGHLSVDEFGRALTHQLESDGVSLDLATFGPEKTTVAMARVDSDGSAHYHFLLDGTSAPQLASAPKLPSGVTAIHVGTLGLVLEPMASTIIDLVKGEHDRRLVMVDPNIRRGLIPDDDYRERLWQVIAHSTIVKASEDDLAWMYPDGGYELAAGRLLRDGVSLVAVTRGRAGAHAAHRDLRVAVPAVDFGVADTIGAGDAFGAALLAWLYDRHAVGPELRLDAEELRLALEYACLAAAITCSRPGADSPWKQELETWPGRRS